MGSWTREQDARAWGCGPAMANFTRQLDGHRCSVTLFLRLWGFRVRHLDWRTQRMDARAGSRARKHGPGRRSLPFVPPQRPGTSPLLPAPARASHASAGLRALGPRPPPALRALQLRAAPGLLGLLGPQNLMSPSREIASLYSHCAAK